jgi:hypothetical protein
MKNRNTWLYLGLLLVMLLTLPMLAGAQGTEPFGGFARLWIFQDTGKTAVFIHQESSTADAIQVQDGNDNNIFTVSGAGDVTLLAATGNNNGTARNQFIGLPRIKLVSLGAGTDGTAGSKTLALMDDSPAGEFITIDAHTTCTADATYAKVGTNSLKLGVLTTGVAGDGCADPIGAPYDFTDDESVGLWLYCDTVLDAGDLRLDINDSVGGHELVAFPAYSPEDSWQWVELDISAIANADKDVVDDVSWELSATGATRAATAAFNCYLDGAMKWDATEEEALGVSIQTDGVISVVAVATAAGSGNTTSDLVLGTDYFINYESGVDFLVWITNQSGNSNFALVAY